MAHRDGEFAETSRSQTVTSKLLLRVPGRNTFASMTA